MPATVRRAVAVLGRSLGRSAGFGSGLTDLGETAAVETIVAPIKRQEPGHHAFYAMSARGLAEQLSQAMADPSSGDMAALSTQAQEMGAKAAELSTANPESVNDIAACSAKVTEALTP